MEGVLASPAAFRYPRLEGSRLTIDRDSISDKREIIAGDIDIADRCADELPFFALLRLCRNGVAWRDDVITS